MGWGGDDNVQVRSKTDLSIDKTKGWGGVGWGGVGWGGVGWGGDDNIQVIRSKTDLRILKAKGCSKTIH